MFIEGSFTLTTVGAGSHAVSIPIIVGRGILFNVELSVQPISVAGADIWVFTKIGLEKTGGAGGYRFRNNGMFVYNETNNLSSNLNAKSKMIQNESPEYDIVAYGQLISTAAASVQINYSAEVGK